MVARLVAASMKSQISPLARIFAASKCLIGLEYIKTMLCDIDLLLKTPGSK